MAKFVDCDNLPSTSARAEGSLSQAAILTATLHIHCNGATPSLRQPFGFDWSIYLFCDKFNSKTQIKDP